MRPITERYANISFGRKTLDRLLLYPSGRGLAQIPWICLQTTHRCGEFLVLTNPLTFNGICFDKALQVWVIPCLGNFFGFPRDLFQQVREISCFDKSIDLQ